MVTSIARQSIILKCVRQKSVMVGNYEFYYAAGLLKRCMGLETSEEMKPVELSDYIVGKIQELEPTDEREDYLIKMLSTFEPDEDIYDDQMKELFRWGAGEQDLWQVQTSYEGT